MTQQVFISYSNENQSDRRVADKIYDTLKARGIPCWAAHRDIAAGQNWPDEISKAISNSRVMIVVLSEYTHKSRYVRREVTQAADEDITIIPVCIEKVSLSGGLKLLLNDCQWINAYPGVQDKDLDQLVMTLHGYLGIAPGKTFKKEEKQFEVVKETPKPFRLKPVLWAASIIIAVIAVGIFISQWTHNAQTTLLENKTGIVKPRDTLSNVNKTKPAEDGPKNTAEKPKENKQPNTATKPIEKKETAKLPDKNKTEKKVEIGSPIKKDPDFIRALKSKGWEVKKNESDCWEAFYKAYDLTMIHIPSGKFMMGSNDGRNDEKPLHEVVLDGYWIGKYEVTFAQYDRYCEEIGKEKPGDEGWGREKRPVINVSWDDAAAYCRWLSQKTGQTFQLPTEAQWEKAGRGSRGFRYPWGNDFDKNKCNSDASGLNKTMPVGSYPAGKSPYGCMDMAGNVWEWCVDWYDGGYYKNSPSKKPPGPARGSLRVLRGGSWLYVAPFCRAASRDRYLPANRLGDVGFRLSRSL